MVRMVVMEVCVLMHRVLPTSLAPVVLLRIVFGEVKQIVLCWAGCTVVMERLVSRSPVQHHKFLQALAASAIHAVSKHPPSVKHLVVCTVAMEHRVSQAHAMWEQVRVAWVAHVWWRPKMHVNYRQGHTTAMAQHVHK